MRGVVREETRVRGIAVERPPDAVLDRREVADGFRSALQVDGCLQLVSDVRVAVWRYCGPAGLRESRVLDRKPGVAAIQVEQEKLTSRGCLTSTIPPLGDNYFSRSASQFSGLRSTPFL